MKLLESKSCRSLLSAALLLAVFLVPDSSHAADLTVDGGATYTLNAPDSIAYQNEYIGLTSNGSFTQNGGTNTVTEDLGIGHEGGSGAYTLNGGTLTAQDEWIAPSGVFTQNGGTHKVSWDLTLWRSGIYLLNDGTLSTTRHIIIGEQGSATFTQNGGKLFASTEIIGNLGSGTFTQNGGTNMVAVELTLGQRLGSSGTYVLNDGDLSASWFMIVGSSGTGTFVQNGGTNKVFPGLILGLDSGGSGAYTLNSGTLSAIYEIVGKEGTGIFTQNGGTNSFLSYDLDLGSYSSSSGAYILNGGNLSARAENIGYGGTGTFTQIGGTNTTSNLYIGLYSGSSGTYNLSGGILSAPQQYIGYEGAGTFTQSGVTNATTNLYLGYNAGSSGTYDLSGGSLSADAEYIGYSGTGTFNQSGGSHATGYLFLGYNSGSSGTYNLSGGALSSGVQIVGQSGSGVFNQSGGSNGSTDARADLYLGYDAGSNGTYNLNGGTHVAHLQYIGYSGTGTFTQSGGNNTGLQLVLGFGSDSTGYYAQSGGTNTVAGSLYIAPGFGSSGTYTLSDGGLSADRQYIGYSGTGTFTQSGGTNTVAAGLTLGSDFMSSGAYNLNGGTLSAFLLSVGHHGLGTFNQNGGSNTPKYLTLGDQWSLADGTYNLNAGSLSSDLETVGLVGMGTFTQTGGTNTTSVGVGIGGPGGKGTYTLSGGSLSAPELFIGTGDGGTGTFTLNGGTLTAGAIFLANGIFNQTGGTLNAATFNQQGGEVRGSLENRGTFNYASGLFSGRLLNYGAVSLASDFTTGNGLANYSTLFIDSGRIVTLNGAGLDNQGMLVVNGTLAGNGALLNNTSGAFYGTGLVSGNFTNSGTVAPGTSVGALHVSGAYTQAASGTLEVEIASPLNYDKLIITDSPGTATLNGTLKPVLLGGFLPGGGQVYNIVTATGGVSGTFSAITGLYISPTLSWQPRYSANGFDLLAQRDYSNPALGLTSNQFSVGKALNGVAGTAIGDLNTVLTAIDRLPNGAAVGNALNQISPEKASALSTLGFGAAGLQQRDLSRRILDYRFDGGTSAGGFLPGFLDISGSGLSCLAGEAGSLDLVSFLGGKTGGGARPGFYLEPAAIIGSRASAGGQTGFDFTIAGFTAGADWKVGDDLLVGLATGYSHASADFDGSGGSVETHTWPITLYGAYLHKPFYAYGSLGYALNLFDIDRNIVFGGLSRRASGSPDGHLFDAYLEAGYDLQVCDAVLTPMASMSYASLWLDGYTETGGGALDLKVFPQDADSLQAGIGGRLSLPLQRSSFTLVPQIYATYQHEFSDGSRGIDARLAQGSPTFSFVTGRVGRDFGVIGADITLLTHRNLKFRIDYNAEVGRSDYTAHYVCGGVRWEF